MISYPEVIERQMQRFYQSLTEKEQRRYAALEALKLGHGGKTYIRDLLGCDYKTQARGLRDLQDEATMRFPGIRQKGGGRKKIVDTQPKLRPLFLELIHYHTAGLPTDATVKWTNLSQVHLAELLAQAGKPVSIPVVSQLLELHDFRPRQAYKTVAGGQHPDRDAQFLKIRELIRSYHAAGHPVLSMDVKQKELIGQFFRHGELYTQERVHVYDHDFRSLADGVVIPHGLYDLKHNLGYLTLGLSRDTSAFAGDCIRHYWRTYGRVLYPHAHTLLILCDCGGSNNARWYVFKEQLQQVVNDLGIEIRMAHYPPYTSKYNPIEHRLFPHVSRACRGLVFSTLDVVTEAMSQTSTKTGLRVFVSLLDKEYQAGNSATEGFREHMEIVFDRELPQWNYRAIPSIA